MESLTEKPKIGVAYAEYVENVIARHPTSVDFVEVAFEALKHNPRILPTLKGTQVILHCSSLSLAGSVSPDDSLVSEIADLVLQTATPWLGEHLSFVTARGAGSEGDIEARQSVSLGYTVGPPMNRQSVESTVRNIRLAKRRFGVPVLVENSPIYFEMPGSEYTQDEFVSRICQSVDVGLILDLSQERECFLKYRIEKRQR